LATFALPQSLSREDIFRAALAAGRAVPEDDAHAKFAECLFKIYEEKSGLDLRLFPSSAGVDLVSLRHECWEAAAARLDTLSNLNYSPAQCAMILRAELHTSKLCVGLDQPVNGKRSR
jgi:hypothetical protein